MTVTITDGVSTSTPFTMQGYSSTRVSQNVFHPVIGRADDDVTLRPAGLRSGTVTFLFDNEADAAACGTLHAGAAILTLADDELATVGMTYVVSGNTVQTLNNDTLTVWLVAADFQEVSV